MRVVNRPIQGYPSNQGQLILTPFLPSLYALIWAELLSVFISPCSMWSGAGSLLHWSFDDPAAKTDPVQRRRIFGRVRDEIAQQIRAFLGATTA
jgi:hypothetical protein